MNYLAQHYRRFQGFAAAHASLVLSVFVLLFVLATAGLHALVIDMSFRPLFASEGSNAEQTTAFESVFGQSSGAWITAILETDSASKADFVRTAATLSDDLGQIEHVSEVLSISAVRITQWHRGKLSFVSPLPDFLFDPEEEEELERQYNGLLDGTRFSNWLVSKDGSRLLLAARLDLPMDDLEGRREVIAVFKNTVQQGTPISVRSYFTGVSVVEAAYEKQVLRDQLIATALASVALMLLLYCAFLNFRSVIVCMLPVGLAIPATLGIMGWLGQSVTIINTVIPAVILVIGVADAVHMLTAWLEARGHGASKEDATESMLDNTGAACFFTTITTMAGFLALQAAELTSIRVFGLAAAIGIFIAWVANQILIPWLLRRIDAGDGLVDSLLNRSIDETLSRWLSFSIERPLPVISAAILLTAGFAFLIPDLSVNQKFNQELPEAHTVNQAQAMLEENFGGFLGPEIGIQRAAGGEVVDDESLILLDQFVSEMLKLPDVQRVWSLRDLLPRNVKSSDRATALAIMRDAPEVRGRVRELVNENRDHMAVIVRIGDVGTRRSAELHAQLTEISKRVWGPQYEVSIVGQWWLAQRGMQLLLRDMLVSFATALLIVMPILWIILRDFRLFIAATLTNILPLAVPLAYMSIAGISLRIGTAVVLAIALGIVVDNTLHVVIRLRRQIAEKGASLENVLVAMRSTGRAVIYTTFAMVGGFLSMMSNQLLAIRDMGIVAAVTFMAAMLADLLLLPALSVFLSDDKLESDNA